MRRLLGIAALALLVAPAAAAKEITGAEICGGDGCRAVALPRGLHDFPGGGGGSGLAETPPMSPFVEIRLEYDGGRHREELWYVPGARVFAMRDGYGSVRWMPVREERLDQVLVRAAASASPLRARVTSAYVGGEPVSGDVSGYEALFGAAAPARGRERGDGFTSVSLHTSPPSPWASSRLWFYPGPGLLQRGIEVVALPRAVAADLRAGRPIDASPDAGGSFDWPLVTGSLLVAALLGGSTLLLSRRSRQLPA